jgi:superfamily II DNA/RNA helicase
MSKHLGRANAPVKSVNSAKSSNSEKSARSAKSAKGPKKARWTTAAKAEARHGRPGRPGRPSTQRPATGATKVHRGQGGVDGAFGRRREDVAPGPVSGSPVEQRAERPARVGYERPDRPARPARTEYQRPDRPARPARTEYQRPSRPDRADHQRPERSPRPEHQRPERSESTERPARRTAPAPVPVREDNPFAALGLPHALVERMARDGIVTPFPIQTATIPDALAGRDVLGRGQTGSGKTFAFGLPTLTRLAAGKRATPRRPRALVLTPTRELAMQISDALEPLAHVMGVRHKLVAGGMPYQPQLSALDRGVELLIATPGRLNDLLERGAVELRDTEVLILDEADHMAEMGFMPEITSILDLLPEGGQRLLFSATLDRGVDELVARYLDDPVTHSTDAATASVTTMEHHVLLVDPMHKKVITGEVANRSGRTLVFVRTKLGADRVAIQLRDQGILAAALHGGLNQGARNRVLGAFRDGSLPVLVATDVAARGIHVDDVSVVLQVDPPADSKDYLHRSGRTARAGERGTVVTLALPHQKRGMERLVRDAGVEVTAVRATPGDEATMRSTGARTPSGVPVAEQQVRRLLEGEPKPRRAPRTGTRPGVGAGAPSGSARRYRAERSRG